MTSNARITLFATLAVLVAMGALAASAPVIYDTFCRVTGFGGTTQQAYDTPEEVLDRKVRIRFDAAVGRGSALQFRATEPLQTLKIGEMGMAFFEVSNPTDQAITAEAGYNVAPHKAGPYFNKLECFCFEEMIFEAGESMTLPVVFFLDPAMDEERTLDDVTEITLSYTFYGRDDGATAQTASLQQTTRHN